MVKWNKIKTFQLRVYCNEKREVSLSEELKLCIGEVESIREVER